MERGLTGKWKFRLSNPQEISDGAATTVINSAKLIQAMGQTEMRVGLHTTDFGDISIRTSGSQQQMSAQISLDHSELSQTIADHIAAVKQSWETSTASRHRSRSTTRDRRIQMIRSNHHRGRKTHLPVPHARQMS